MYVYKRVDISILVMCDANATVGCDRRRSGLSNAAQDTTSNVRVISPSNSSITDSDSNLPAVLWQLVGQVAVRFYSLHR
jgi:hypothetical protein